MKILRNIAYSALIPALFALAACSDDAVKAPDGSGTQTSGSSDDVQLALHFSFPAKTRGTTTGDGGSSDGNQGALSGEEKMSNFALTLLYPDNSGAYVPIPDCSFAGTFEGSYVKIAVSPKTVWQYMAGKTIRVRMTVNGGYAAGSTDYTSDIAKTAFDKILDCKDIEDATNGYSLPMANEYEFPVDMTALTGATESAFNSLLESLLDRDRTLDLSEDARISGTNTEAGTLSLERGVARIDYKPKNWTKTQDPTTNPLDAQVFKVGEIPNLYAKMYSIQLLNVSREGFTFRHVSEGDQTHGERTGGAEIVLGKENSNPYYDDDTDYSGNEPADYNNYNWIKDTDWDNKNTWNSTANWTGPVNNTDGSTYFLNQPTKLTGEPIYTVHPTRVAGADTYYGLLNVYDHASFFNSDYKTRAISDDNYLPLWYVAENTLPSTESMKNGMSTGLAFRMVLCKEDGTPLTPSDFDENYAPNPENPTNVKVKGKLEDFNSTYPGYYKLTIGSQERYAEIVSLPGHDTGYAITYYYFFKHNISNPHTLGTVEPMQYAVVRNNIYKVCVTALNGLPDPYDPGKPDEPSENFIAVETAVLSWARVSNPDIDL